MTSLRDYLAQEFENFDDATLDGIVDTVGDWMLAATGSEMFDVMAEPDEVYQRPDEDALHELDARSAITRSQLDHVVDNLPDARTERHDDV